MNLRAAGHDITQCPGAGGEYCGEKTFIHVGFLEQHNTDGENGVNQDKTADTGHTHDGSGQDDRNDGVFAENSAKGVGILVSW